MVLTNYVQKMADAAGIKSLVIGMLIASCGVNILLAVAIVSLNKETRTVNLPPKVDKGFWIEGEKMSPEYIEQMGNYVTQLMLNVTPNSVQYQGKMVLDITAPASYNSLKHKTALSGAVLNRDGVSTFFSPRQVYTDAQHFPNKVAFGGNLSVVMSDKKVSEFAKVYLVEFGFVAGRTALIDFKETNDRDPFGIKLTATEDNLDAALLSTEAAKPAASSAK
jgi:conjugal transfer pilus assembly protein TraE